MQNVKKMHVKTGDTVMVRSGKYAKAVGKVIGVSPKEGKVIVEDVHMVHKHVKPRKQGEAGGIIETAGAIYACKVQLYCLKCQKGARVAHKVTANGEKIRTCARCGCDFRVRGTPPQPQRVFDAAGLPQVIVFERGE